jgi:predicted GNAT superfamily acetyltransferase
VVSWEGGACPAAFGAGALFLLGGLGYCWVWRGRGWWLYSHVVVAVICMGL